MRVSSSGSFLDLHHNVISKRKFEKFSSYFFLTIFPLECNYSLSRMFLMSLFPVFVACRPATTGHYTKPNGSILTF